MDVILVLGCQLYKRGKEFVAGELLVERLEKALEIYQTVSKGTTFFIVSGGFGKKLVSESQVMKKWLVDHGVDGNYVAEEDKSISTIQNFIYSKKLLDNIIQTYPMQISTIHVVSSDFHMDRIKAINHAYKTFELYPNVSINYVGSITKDRQEYDHRMEHETIILEKFFS